MELNGRMTPIQRWRYFLAPRWESLILLVNYLQWLKGTESPKFQELGPYVYDVSPESITPCLIKGDPSQGLAACTLERMILSLHPKT